MGIESMKNFEGKVRHPFGSSGLKPGKGLTQLLAVALAAAEEEEEWMRGRE